MPKGDLNQKIDFLMQLLIKKNKNRVCNEFNPSILKQEQIFFLADNSLMRCTNL